MVGDMVKDHFTIRVEVAILVIGFKAIKQAMASTLGMTVTDMRVSFRTVGGME